MKNSNVKFAKAIPSGGVVLCSNPLLSEEIPYPEMKGVVSELAEPAEKKVRVREEDEVILNSIDGRCFVLTRKNLPRYEEFLSAFIHRCGLKENLCHGR